MKKIFPLGLFVAIFSLLLAFPVQADTCSSQKAGFACVDTGKVSGTSGCVKNLCPGSTAVQCCPLSTVQCKADGSSALQKCSVNGNYGLCNAAGECVDTNAGPISTVAGSASSGIGGVTPSDSSVCGPNEFCNPLRFKTVDQFLSQILGALQKIIVTLSLLMIVYGAVLYVISAGGDQIKTAKNTITAALVGLAIGIAAPSFLKEIAGILGWGTTDTRLAGALSLTQIATNILNFLLGTLGILSLIMLVYGAGMYLTSAGDSKQVDTGKNIFKYALLGVFLAMASMVLVTQVAKLFVAG